MSKQPSRSIENRGKWLPLLRRSAIREPLIFFAFIALTVAMTWPWVRHLREGVPDAGDTYSIAYFLWWDFHQTFHNPLSLFHANVFYPYKYSLAFGENDFGISLLFFPLFAIGLRPLTVYSIAALTSFAFSGYGAFRLTRTLSGSSVAAWTAGVIFAFVPYRFQHLNHLHLIFAGWIPLTLEALVLFVRERSWKRALWLALAFVMNALTCLTWFVLILIPLAMSAALLLARNRTWRTPAVWLRLGAASLLAALLLLPFLLPYVHVARNYGFVREATEVQTYSAHLINWRAAGNNKLWQGVAAAGARPEMALFPGLLPLLLAAAAVVIAITYRRRSSQNDSETIFHGLVWTSVGFMGSLGLNFFFHRFLYEYVPIFRSMRVAARWSMICYVGLALLAGLGAKYLAELIRTYGPRPQLWVTGVVLIAALLFEQRPASISLIKGEAHPDELTLYLRNKEMRGGIVELPAGYPAKRYMLRAADHGRPLITAKESFMPPIAVEIERLTSAQPIPDRFLDLLEQIPASYLTLHNGLATPENLIEIEQFLDRALASGRLRFIKSFPGEIRNGIRERNDLYAVTRTEPDSASESTRPPRFSIENPQTSLISNFETSFFIYRLHRASYGRNPLMTEFMADAKLLLSRPDRAALVNSWVERPQFKSTFDGLNDQQYVETLLRHTGATGTEAIHAELVKALTNRVMTRAEVLRKITDDEAFTARELDSALVLVHYFAYLQRDPEPGGFYFWLDYLKRVPDRRNFTEVFAASTERLDQPVK